MSEGEKWVSERTECVTYEEEERSQGEFHRSEQKGKCAEERGEERRREAISGVKERRCVRGEKGSSSGESLPYKGGTPRKESNECFKK